MLGSGSGNSGVLGSAANFQGFRWDCSAEAEATASLSASLWMQVKCGYSGPVKAVTVREYLTSAPNADPAVTLICPVRGTVSLHSTGHTIRNVTTYTGQEDEAFLQSNSYSSRVSDDRHEVPIGPFLHSNPTLTNATPPTATQSATSTSGSTPAPGMYPSASSTATATGSATLHLPTSTSVPGAGTAFVLASVAIKWRFGVWIRETVTIYHP